MRILTLPLAERLKAQWMDRKAPDLPAEEKTSANEKACQEPLTWRAAKISLLDARAFLP
jgi:hypothetical protein